MSEINVGDIVSVDLELDARLARAPSVEEVFPYFRTPGADEYLVNGGTFEVLEVGHASGFATVVPTGITLCEDYDDGTGLPGNVAYIFEEALVLDKANNDG